MMLLVVIVKVAKITVDVTHFVLFLSGGNVDVSD